MTDAKICNMSRQVANYGTTVQIPSLSRVKGLYSQYVTDRSTTDKH